MYLCVLCGKVKATKKRNGRNPLPSLSHSAYLIIYRYITLRTRNHFARCKYHSLNQELKQYGIPHLRYGRKDSSASRILCLFRFSRIGKCGYLLPVPGRKRFVLAQCRIGNAPAYVSDSHRFMQAHKCSIAFPAPTAEPNTVRFI